MFKVLESRLVTLVVFTNNEIILLHFVNLGISCCYGVKPCALGTRAISHETVSLIKFLTFYIHLV